MHVQVLFYLTFKVAAFALFHVWVFWSDAVFFDPQNNIFYCNRDCSSQAAQHIEHSSLNYSGQRSSTRQNVFIANKQTICRCHLPAAVLLCGCVVCTSCACAARRGGVFLYLHISYIYTHICTFLFICLFIYFTCSARWSASASEIFGFSSSQVSASSIDTLFFCFVFFLRTIFGFYITLHFTVFPPLRSHAFMGSLCFRLLSNSQSEYIPSSVALHE